MGCALKEWVFYSEQKENGRIICFAKNLSDMKIYRWESVAAKLMGSQVAKLRNELSERSKTMEHHNNGTLGVLNVYGPHFHQGLFWLCWEARQGESLWSLREEQVKASAFPAQTMRDLYPLIHSYLIYCQAGVVVGKPDWGRIYRDHQGIYMIDPSQLPYLAASEYKPPLGLEFCRPPETFDGSKTSGYGDLFYLGLIIYLALTNRLPFAIQGGWPIKALLKGEVISPAVFQPELSPLLVGQIKDLLNPNPEKRGTIQQLEAFWRLMLEQKSFLATPRMRAHNIKKQRMYNQQIRLQKIHKPALLAIVSCLTILFISWIIFGPIQVLKKQSGANPIHTAQQFYQTAAGPPQAPLRFQSNPDLILDFNRARKIRLQTAAELLIRPLAEIRRTRFIFRTNRRAVIEVWLNRWEWGNQDWRIQAHRELLNLEIRGNQWFITHRKVLD